MITFLIKQLHACNESCQYLSTTPVKLIESNNSFHDNMFTQLFVRTTEVKLLFCKLTSFKILLGLKRVYKGPKGSQDWTLPTTLITTYWINKLNKKIQYKSNCSQVFLRMIALKNSEISQDNISQNNFCNTHP